MRQLRIATTVGVLGALAACTSAAAVRPSPLPAAFAPLSWSSRVEELQMLFPGAEIQLHDQDHPKRRLAVVIGARTGALGNVDAIVEADRKGEAWLIVFSHRDPRPECEIAGRGPEAVPAELDCEWRRSPRALRVLHEWEGMLRKQLGAPSRRVERPKGHVLSVWERTDHAVGVGLVEGDDGMWEVALSAWTKERDAQFEP